MGKIKIGVSLEALQLPLRRALQAAQRLGVGGVEVAAVGDLAPGQLTQTGRREFRHLLRSYNVELTALRCPLRRGLGVAENQEARIDHVKGVMSLSFDLGPRITIVEGGKVPEKPEDPGGALLTEAMQALAAHGDRVGAVLALETGLESGETLRQFLGRFDTGSLGVNYDPGNLLMKGFAPMEDARALAGRIVHAHARDARKTGPSREAQEVPVGQGDVDWIYLAGVLEEIDYRGWMTVQRDSGSNRQADVEAGVAFLRRILG